MPIAKLAILLASLTSVATVQAQGKLDRTGRLFLSEKYGFSMAVPPGWGVSVDQDTPLYVSYPAPRALPQGRIPEGGANLSVVPLDIFQGFRSRTLSEWASADARGDSALDVPVRAFDMPAETGVKRAVISTYDTPTFGPDDQSQHTLNVYWEFRSKVFAAHLFYPAHDPKGSEFERIFLTTIRSIRPLPETGARPNAR